VNETIMIGDPAGGDTFEDSLNKCLCKNAFVKLNEQATSSSSDDELWSKYIWYDNSPFDPKKRNENQEPPRLITAFHGIHREDYTCVYKIPELKERYAKTFTEEGSPGVIYRDLYNKIEKAMRIPEGCEIDPRLTKDGVHYLIVPAFFETLQKLQDREFHVIIRTFGTDGPEIAEAMNAWAEGKHPLFPNTQPDRGIHFPPTCLWEGRFNPENGKYSLKPDTRMVDPASGDDSHRDVCLDETAAVELMKTNKCLILQDDYLWWKGNGYSPSAGKPLWISSHDEEFHPIFFDDNIHNDATDSIVSVRHRRGQGQPFVALCGEAICQLQGVFLVRVPTLEVILDHSWFFRHIEQCEQIFSSGEYPAL
jgi:hypothetical protein